MPGPNVLRIGSRGESVRDLQIRLAALGFGCVPDEPGLFGPGTEGAIRRFQLERGLQVDGVAGPDTWSSLVESGFELGDRLLYYRQPFLRGDDVADLQRRLLALGFDARRVDGLFGVDTQRALVEFQRSTGLVGDGICGPSTIASLERVGGFADGSVASVRERDELRHGPHHVAGRRVFVATTPGLAVVGEAVTRGLNLAGAIAVLDSSGDDESVLARAANAYDAELFVGLWIGREAGARCVYFETEGFRSELGHHVASVIRDELEPELAARVALTGRAYPVLRETKMAAVVCAVAGEGDPGAFAAVVGRSGAVARAIVRAIRHAWERPPYDPEPGAAG